MTKSDVHAKLVSAQSGQGDPSLRTVCSDNVYNEKISPHYIIRGGILAYNGWMNGQKTNAGAGRIPTILKTVKVNGGT